MKKMQIKDYQEKSKSVKLLSLFSGIGAFEKALTNLKVDYELLGYCEIDKYASKAYSLIHGVDESLNLGDITKIDSRDILKPVDLITYGFPCQDISVAGNQKGLFNEDGSNTRSGLFFDALRIIRHTQPKIAIAENVKNLVGKRFKVEFEIVLQSLEEAGYNNYWKVLNAKDYGIPQNRERVFIVSIREDIDPYANTIEGFPWPLPFDNGLRLKDFLEDEVDEKFYIADEKAEKLISQMTAVVEPCILRPERTEYGKAARKQYENGDIKQSRHNMTELKPRKDGISNTLTTVQKDNFLAVPCLTPDRVEKRQNGRRFKEDGDPMFTLTSQDRHGVLLQEGIDFSFNNPRLKDIANCISARQDRGVSNRRSEGTGVLVKEATKKGFAIAKEGDSINLEHPNSKTRRGRVGVAQTLTTSCNQAVIKPNKINQIGNIVETDSFGGNPQTGRVYGEDGIAPTLNTCGGGQREPKVLTKYRIRKLTPKECWRLMGFSDEDFNKVKDSGMSNSQLYKQAGNSIVVDVPEEILCQLLDENNEIYV